MNYQEALDWLYSTQQFGIKLGLGQTKRLLRETLCFPKPKVKVIHVAGTNGKGSTCAIIDSLARACATRSGLFTSPHLVDYCERIQVGGIEIDQETCAEYLTDLKEQVSNWEQHPTFFELTLAVAMRYFREKDCELIILETGMGGRLDSTTAVPADVAVITPIGMDHSQYLGDTLEAIALEKAGIIVPKKPVISSPQQPSAYYTIEQEANERCSPLEFIEEPLQGYTINLPGLHQKQNAAVAIAAAEQVGLTLNYDTVRQALMTVKWPGRFEKIDSPHAIFDGAHNPHAAQALVQTWQHEYPDQKAQIIFGAVQEKNINEVLAILTPIADHIHFTPIDSPRSLTLDDYQKVSSKNTPYTIHKNLKEALSTANAQANQPPTLICGSLFLIGQVKAFLTNKKNRSSSQ